MEKLIKAVFLVIILLGLVILMKLNQHQRDRGLCVMQQHAFIDAIKTEAGSRKGLKFPQCTPKGYFISQQCSLMTNSCWCVDFVGQKIVGTEVMGFNNQPLACHLSWLERAYLKWQLRSDEALLNQKSAATPVAKTTLQQSNE